VADLPVMAGASRRRILGLVLLAAILALRLVPVVMQPSLDWGDEVYQAIEPAHRLVFGTGLETWEFVSRIRSWLLPGVIAGIMEVVRPVGTGPRVYLPAIAVCFGALSLVPVAGSFLWCRRAFGLWPAMAAASVAGLAPEMIYFGARTLAETTAAHVLIAGMFLAATWPDGSAPSRRRGVSAGLLLGLAIALRPQVAPAVLVIVTWPGAWPGAWPAAWGRWFAAAERRPHQAGARSGPVPGTAARLAIVAGIALALGAASVLDWVTLGAPSASIWRYLLVNLHGASASFGVQPWYYFGLAEAAIWGIALPVPAMLCLAGARRWATPLVAALAILAAHMLIGHKEHRFIYPALALASVSAGIGMAAAVAQAGALLRARAGWVSDRAGGDRMAAVGCMLAWGGLCAAVWVGPGMRTLRARVSNQLAAADYAAALPGICGIGMGPEKDAWVPYGGYSHLGQDVPLLWPADQAAFGREKAGFNLLLSAQREPGFAVLRCFGEICAAERVGGCEKMPADTMPPAPNRLGGM
jgi:phosphatidylinositol glycan class B